MRCRALAAAVVAIASVASNAATASASEPGPSSFDGTPPEIWVNSPTSHGEGVWSGWYREPVNLLVYATDNLGVVTLDYELTGAQTGSGQVDQHGVALHIKEQGVTRIDMVATDLFNNTTARDHGVGIDLTDPTVTFSGDATSGQPIRRGQVRTLVSTCADVPTAVLSCWARIGDEPFGLNQPVPTNANGPIAITVTAEDAVGRWTEQQFAYTVVDPLLQVTGQPAISGNPATARVGQTLTATGGTFAPAASRVDYHWKIEGRPEVLSPTYEVRAEDIGKRISLYATGHRDNYEAATTQTVGNVLAAAGELQVTGQPAISGNPTTARVGQTLTATGGTFAPAASRVDYHWKIEGRPEVLSPTYEVRAEDIGKRISLYATGHRDNYEAATTQTVGNVSAAAGELQVTGQPTATGTAREGGVLEVRRPAITPQPQSERTLWSINGAVVETAGRLTLGAEHVGRQVSCAQVYSRAGYADVRVPCQFAGGATSVTVTGNAWAVKAPTAVKGKAKVGKRLRAVLPQLSGRAGSYAYQWLRNGKPIAGATAPSYKIRKGDAKRRISVRVTATTPHRPAVVSVSKATKVRR